jgi:hypothetical protein
MNQIGLPCWSDRFKPGGSCSQPLLPRVSSAAAMYLCQAGAAT